MFAFIMAEISDCLLVVSSLPLRCQFIINKLWLPVSIFTVGGLEEQITGPNGSSADTL
jgi:hypothetical protein